jgi:hypothetical protein
VTAVRARGAPTCYDSTFARIARAHGPGPRDRLEDVVKKNIHPKMVPCKVICEGQVVLETYSTRPEVHVDVWSGNHPFYTGQ